MKLGDRVMMRPNNQYWSQNDNKHNPKYEEGTIDNCYSESSVTVQWSGGGHNSYSTEDLQLVTAETYQIY